MLNIQIVPAAFVRAIFLEFLNIIIPYNVHVFLYSKDNIGNPEIISYSNISDKNIPEIIIYGLNAPNNYKKINATFKNVLELIKVGNILNHYHMILVPDIIKNKDGEKIDAICMHSSTGIGKSRIEQKQEK